MLLYVHRDLKGTIRDRGGGGGDQDVHLDFHTAPERSADRELFKFNDGALRPQRPYGQLGMGSPGRPPRLSHSS